jgi:hypothetical protein
MANTPNPNPSTAWTWNEFATDAPTYPWTAWPADYTWLPKAADLTDTFDTQIDPTLWPNKYGTTAWAAGQATLTERPSNYSGLVSAANAYDLSNSSIFARLTPPATMAASSETALAVYQDSSNGVWFSIINNAGVTALLVYTKIAGARVQVNRPYNPVQAAYPDVRHHGLLGHFPERDRLDQPLLDHHLPADDRRHRGNLRRPVGSRDHPGHRHRR